MRFYLAQQMHDATEPHRGTMAIILGSGWATLQEHFALFPASSPVFWITTFWVLDWLLGSALAIRDRRWIPAKSARSVAKWCLWMFALAVAWGFRDAAFLGATYVASIMEAAILMAEGSSVLRNAADLSDNPLAKKLLGCFASAVEDRVEQLEHRMVTGEEHSATNAEHIAANTVAIRKDTAATAGLAVVVRADIAATAQISDRVDAIEKESKP